MKLWISIFTLVIGCLGNVFFRAEMATTAKERPGTLLIPPQDLKHFSLGFDELVADSLWIRVIQDFDQCGTPQSMQKPSGIKSETRNVVHPQANSKALKEDLSVSRVGNDSSVDSILTEASAEASCSQGWVFHMLNAITDLTPRFRIIYSSGATMLGTVVDDSDGAAQIFEKGIKQFPNDWSLAYSAGVHYLYRMQNAKRAAELFDIASRNGAPEWTHLLASTLYSRSGQLVLALATLKKLVHDYPNLEDNPRVQKRIHDVEESLKKLKASEKENRP